MNKGKGFGLGLGKMKELAEAFKKAQEVQEGAKKLQQELETMEIEGKSEDGLVTVVMSGNQEPLRVIISDEAMGKGSEALSASVTSALQQTYQISTDTMRQKMEDLTGGLGLPGM
ncbi:MAG: YbaB/EbfC family nucleoid-associated protein [Cyanobacterium sp. T60_A2020_053]|nr:YbaB/EbfC family nucleoid-associated protein [Cyanobacterium sp. T60_A2020_053]